MGPSEYDNNRPTELRQKSRKSIQEKYSEPSILPAVSSV
jgi:hypothetical protein